MPTRPRKHQLTGSLMYHVYNRSIMRVPIFRSDGDYLYWMELLIKYAAKFSVKIYHWVIMHNHFHLLLEIEEPHVISALMAGIQHTYTVFHHRRNDGCGFLWQGRFKLQPVQKERYLAACGRYIERNPLRAGLVTLPEEYRYSSAAYYCLGTQDGITSIDPLYGAFGRSEKERRAQYRLYLQDFDTEEDDLFRGTIVPAGDTWFLARLGRMRGRYMPRHEGKPRVH